LDPREVAQRHDDAWNSKDVEARKQCYSSDVSVEIPGMRLQGLDQVQQVEAVFWEALPDSQLKITEELVAGDAVIREGILTGTHTGTFRTPQGEVPPSGNAVNLRYAAVKRIDDGKVVSEHLYFDQMEFMMQIGALPGPGPS
jgi:steroid delta-isomerase-like uncharacterized protein